ncbi:MAG: hypothetical protein GC181_12745 [Bacteroidetes bacterium]|nr:hypothetical protein [Bacteroidota bacterium]
MKDISPNSSKWGVVLLFVIFSILFYFKVFGGFVDYDSQAFQAIGLHLSKGKVLYKEVWDAKPIGVYAIDALAFKAFGVSQNSIWILQWLFGLMNILLFFKIAVNIFNNHFLSHTSSLFFCFWFYFSEIYQGGNFTEEYATTCMLAGIYYCFTFYKNQRLHGIFFSLFFFSLATFFKEPYFFSAIGWIVFLIYQILQGKEKTKNISFLLLGGLMPWILFVLYLWLTSSFQDYYKHLVYNIEYSRFQEMSFSDKLSKAWIFFKEMLERSFPIAFVVLILTPVLLLVKKYRLYFILFATEFLIGWYSIQLSGYQFQHYYMQISVAMIFLIFMLSQILIEKITAMFNSTHLEWAGLIVLFLLPGYVLFINLPKKTSEEIQPFYKQTVEMIKSKKKSDSGLFVQELKLCEMYVQSDMISNQTIPVSFFTFFMVQDKFAVDRIENYVNSFRKNPPQFIVQNQTEGMLQKHEKLKEWFPANYLLINQEIMGSDTVSLYQKMN